MEETIASLTRKMTALRVPDFILIPNNLPPVDELDTFTWSFIQEHRSSAKIIYEQDILIDLFRLMFLINDDAPNKYGDLRLKG